MPSPIEWMHTDRKSVAVDAKTSRRERQAGKAGGSQRIDKIYLWAHARARMNPTKRSEWGTRNREFESHPFGLCVCVRVHVPLQRRRTTRHSYTVPAECEQIIFLRVCVRVRVPRLRITRTQFAIANKSRKRNRHSFLFSFSFRSACDESSIWIMCFLALRFLALVPHHLNLIRQFVWNIRLCGIGEWRWRCSWKFRLLF